MDKTISELIKEGVSPEEILDYAQKEKSEIDKFEKSCKEYSIKAGAEDLSYAFLDFFALCGCELSDIEIDDFVAETSEKLIEVSSLLQMLGEMMPKHGEERSAQSLESEIRKFFNTLI